MSVRNEAKVNFLGLGTVVYLGMNRIKLYESAIKDLHDVKMKQAKNITSNMVIEMVFTATIVIVITFLAIGSTF